MFSSLFSSLFSFLVSSIVPSSRKLVLGLTLACATLTLSACGGPSESEAKDVAVKLVSAVYHNDVKTIMSYLPNQEQLSSAERQFAESKIGEMLELNQSMLVIYGGLDSIEAVACELNDQGVATVTVRTTFNDGSSKDGTLKLTWQEEVGHYVVQQQ